MKTFIQYLRKFLTKKQIITDELYRYAYSTDASVYRIVPEIVLLIHNEIEVQSIIQLANQFEIPITFRAAGTSLSGQALGHKVLVVLAHGYFDEFSYDTNTKIVTIQPGIILDNVNKQLAKYNRKVGPDPASIATCKIGGVIANNSSGMCCGTTQNSYQTLAAMRLILADGSILDTNDSISLQHFQTNQQDLLSQLTTIRNEIINNTQLSDFIKHKFAIKNTSGYSLNAFLDFSNPIEILTHLLVGSEGTLGFVSSVSLHSIENHNYKAVNLIICKNPDAAVNLTIAIGDTASAIEFLDSKSLQSVAHIEDLQKFLPEIIQQDTCALLIELSSNNLDNLQKSISLLNNELTNIATIMKQSSFLIDKTSYDLLWNVRKGTLPSIAAKRIKDSSVVIEDIAVNLHSMAELINDLQKLFIKYNYPEGAIFGHALAGNLHFVFTPSFASNEALQNYADFMQEFTYLVVNKYQGSLKAEHGSGRNISPFALLEWGQECYDLMWRIKNLLDPKGILNPDVKLTHNPNLHLENLKQIKPIDEQIDACMECGFCEPVCPSRKLTLTPRQRIIVSRKMATLPKDELQNWQKTYAYAAIESCAITNMCQTRCPVGIDTGAYISKLKQATKEAAKTLPSHTKVIKHLKEPLQFANNLSKIIGKNNLSLLSTQIHKVIPIVPVYRKTTPKINQQPFVNSTTQSTKSVYLLASCSSKLFVGSNDWQTLLERLGYQVKYLAKNEDLCCGQMYNSQGNIAHAKLKQQELLSTISNQELLLIDNSSCSKFIAQASSTQIIDINNFLLSTIDKTKLIKKYNKLALHIDCSTQKLGLSEELRQLLSFCANEVIEPLGIACCGFAGDKGFKLPELNQSSLDNLAKQVKECDIGVSFNPNCCIGLNDMSDVQYTSLAKVILECYK